MGPGYEKQVTYECVLYCPCVINIYKWPMNVLYCPCVITFISDLLMFSIARVWEHLSHANDIPHFENSSGNSPPHALVIFFSNKNVSSMLSRYGIVACGDMHFELFVEWDRDFTHTYMANPTLVVSDFGLESVTRVGISIPYKQKNI